MAKLEKQIKESQHMEELVRPVGIVEVWQQLPNGKARVLVPIVYKPGKDWWEFPGGRISEGDSAQSENMLDEVKTEIYEETGLNVPEEADEIEIPFSRTRFLAQSHEIVDKSKNRIIKTKPFIFRFLCGSSLPTMELNKSGVIEVDDYRWLDMTPYYKSDYRGISLIINDTVSSQSLDAFPDPYDNTIVTWTPSYPDISQESFKLSEVTSKALFDYGYWVMHNIPVQDVEFQGLRVE